MILVGLTGSIGHGKSTFAHFLGEAAESHWHIESSDIIIEIANKLRQNLIDCDMPKEGAMELWLHDLSQWIAECTHTAVDLRIKAGDFIAHPEEYEKLFVYRHLVVSGLLTQSEPIVHETKAAHRPLLQWLGGFLAKHVSETLLYDEIVRRAKMQDVALVTAGGLRFAGDARAIKSYAPSYIVAIERPTFATSETTDLTERERALIVPDSIVINDQDLATLKQKALNLYSDLSSGTVRTRY